MLYPFEFTKFGIERATLERSQLECKSRTKLTNGDFGASIFEFISIIIIIKVRIVRRTSHACVYLQMMPEEDVVTLIVKRDHFASFELWLVVIQRGQHAAHGVSQSRGHVVHDHLRTALIVTCTILVVQNTLNLYILILEKKLTLMSLQYRTLLRR